MASIRARLARLEKGNAVQIKPPAKRKTLDDFYQELEESKGAIMKEFYQ